MPHTPATTRKVEPEELTDRQRQALDLIQAYRQVAHEMPSYGWLSRRLGVSRQRAVEYFATLSRKNWLPSDRSNRSR